MIISYLFFHQFKDHKKYEFVIKHTFRNLLIEKEKMARKSIEVSKKLRLEKIGKHDLKDEAKKEEIS